MSIEPVGGWVSLFQFKNDFNLNSDSASVLSFITHPSYECCNCYHLCVSIQVKLALFAHIRCQRVLLLMLSLGNADVVRLHCPAVQLCCTNCKLVTNVGAVYKMYTRRQQQKLSYSTWKWTNLTSNGQYFVEKKFPTITEYCKCGIITYS